MNHHRFFFRATGLALVLSAAAAVPASATDDRGGQSIQIAQAPSTDMTDGEVRKIDTEAGKVTLRHAEIKSLDMPPMTMVFVVKDKALLGKLKTGDKVRFKAINDAGKYTVTEIDPVR